MNVAEFPSLFDSEHVDPDSYSLDGGTPAEAHVLERTPSGWSVYYSERGRAAEVALATENKARAQFR